MTRFGTIACSSVARRRFLPALCQAANARLERVGSRDSERARQYAEQFGCSKWGTYEDVLSDSEVDAVYISTPPLMHADMAIQAADAGKNVLCEKPAFTSIEAAQKTLRRCASTGVHFNEGYAFRWHPQHQRARELVGEGRIGTVRFMQAQYTYPRPPANDIRHQPELGGGVFHDAVGYAVSAALMHVPGEPETISCRSTRDSASGVDSGFAAQLAFSGGQVAHLFVGFDVYYASRYTLIGSAGRIELQRAFAVPPERSATLIVENEDGEFRESFPGVDQFRLMIEDLANRYGAPSTNSDHTELLRHCAVMEAARVALQENSTVSIKNLFA